jgi:hypothetical protein
MHEIHTTDALTWSQRLVLGGLLALLLACATAVGLAPILASHHHTPTIPVPPATVIQIPSGA